MKKLAIFVSAIVLSACGCDDNISGRWVQPVPGIADMQQGINLESDGTAQSINMATLEYTGWTRDGDTLTMRGRSIGNHQTIDFTETWDIVELTCDTLVLRRDDYSTTYTREKK